MKYILFEAGPVTVYSYGLMIALGVILTFVVAQKLSLIHIYQQ